jgi:hypothetical protein
MEKRTFYVTVNRDDGEQGAWEVPEALFGAFRMFMDTARALHDGVKYYGDQGLGSNSVNPRLVNTGTKKIAAIKLLRQYFGWDLLTAKNKADSAPVVLPAVPSSVAQELQSAFIRDGCGEIEIPNVLERMAKAL